MPAIQMSETGAGGPRAGQGPRIVALHWNDICSPWRIFIPLTALRNAGYRTQAAPIREVDDLPDADVLVLHCPGRQGSLRLVEEARRRGIRTIVDVDDLFEPGSVRSNWVEEELRAVRAGSHETDPGAILTAAIHRFHACLRAADAVTVSTVPLATAYRSLNPRVHVLPNCYDDSNPLWNAAPPARRTVNIGFAGMNTHQRSLALLKGALEGVLRAHPEVRIAEAGGPELLPQLDAPKEQLVHLGTVPFNMFPLLLHQMDIVVAPLIDEPFTRCKSNIRCMTAGLVGAPVVASPVGAYAEYVRHGVNGFHARCSEEWARYLDRLVADPALRRRLGAANREQARHDAISANIRQWESVYEGVLASGPA